jgi:lipoate-protein ligase A
MPRLQGPAAELHSRELAPEPGGGVQALVLEVERPALVLGSTQAFGVVDADVARSEGIDVVQRRSGGGAVLLVPGEHLWVDVLLPRDDARWADDVSASSLWLGDAWGPTVAELADGPAEVHRGPMRRDALSDLVCFAGLAPGEVTVGGAKAVGISQRRTRAGARFQCVTYRHFEVDLLAKLLALEPLDVRALDVAEVDVEPEDLLAELGRHLPG